MSGSAKNQRRRTPEVSFGCFLIDRNKGQALYEITFIADQTPEGYAHVFNHRDARILRRQGMKSDKRLPIEF
jgi:hypothetical protein